MASDLWNLNLITLEKSTFIPELEKIGKVYMFYPDYYNFERFNPYVVEKDLLKYYEKTFDHDFSIKDINVEKSINELVSKLKKLNYHEMFNHWIPVCTSFGTFFGMELIKQSRIFDTKLSIINIEASHISTFGVKKFKNTMDEYEEKYKLYNNKDLNELYEKGEKIVKSEMNKDDLLELQEIHKQLSIITYGKLLSNIDVTNINGYGVNSLNFQNLIVKSVMSEADIKKNMLKVEESEFLSKNDDKYKIVWMVNKGHVAFGTDSHNIIYSVKKFLL